MEKKQTAVEYLFKHIEGVQIIDWYEFLKLKDVLEIAKEMEKQQCIRDYCEGFLRTNEHWNGEYGLTDVNNISNEIDAEHYYNITYGKETDRYDTKRKS